MGGRNFYFYKLWSSEYVLGLFEKSIVRVFAESRDAFAWKVEKSIFDWKL